MLIPAQRHALILEFIRQHKTASIQQIMQQLGASQSTIRRDLQELTDSGYLNKTRGGVMLRERSHTMFEPSREISRHIAETEKVLIGGHAAARIEEGQSVIFDSSSTVLEIAKAAARRSIRFTAVTNDLAIAFELANFPKVRVIVVGGTLRDGFLTLTGDPGIDFLSRLSVDMAFIGVHSLAGLRASETSLEVVRMKRTFIKAARVAVIAADSRKFDEPAFCEICPLSDFDELITDEGIPAESYRQIEEAGVKVTRSGLAVKEGVSTAE